MTRTDIDDWWDAAGGEIMRSPFDNSKENGIVILDMTCATWERDKRLGKRFSYHPESCNGDHLSDRLTDVKLSILREAHGWLGGKPRLEYHNAVWRLRDLRERARQPFVVFGWAEKDFKWRFLAAHPIAAQAFFLHVPLTQALGRPHDARGYYIYERGLGIDSGRLIEEERRRYMVSYRWLPPRTYPIG